MEVSVETTALNIVRDREEVASQIRTRIASASLALAGPSTGAVVA
jgi:hypothetical protein